MIKILRRNHDSAARKAMIIHSTDRFNNKGNIKPTYSSQIFQVYDDKKRKINHINYHLPSIVGSLVGRWDIICT